jgi:hypothetical protein
MDYDKLFIDACNKNDINTVDEIHIYVESKSIYNEGLINACRLGCVDIVEFIINVEDFKTLDYQEAFVVACTNGYLRIAKILHHNFNDDIDMHAEDYDAFVSTCFNGYTDVAQWLWCPDIPETTLKTALKFASRNGYESLVKEFSKDAIYVVTYFGCNSTPNQMWSPETYAFKSYKDALARFMELCPEEGEMTYLNTYDQECIENEKEFTRPEGVTIKRITLRN